MVITFTTVLLGLAALIYPLRRNVFYLLSSGMVIGAAWWLEQCCFTTSLFSFKTLLLFVVFHLVAVNFSTFVAYGVDKRAAQRGAWRVREADLHILEFIGGWMGAWVGQKFFHHKTAKKSFQNMYKLMIVMEIVAVYVILNYLNLI